MIFVATATIPAALLRLIAMVFVLGRRGTAEADEGVF
jgi:hypothetical protein